VQRLQSKGGQSRGRQSRGGQSRGGQCRGGQCRVGHGQGRDYRGRGGPSGRIVYRAENSKQIFPEIPTFMFL
jgi:hypothetical protein